MAVSVLDQESIYRALMLEDGATGFCTLCADGNNRGA